MNVSVFWSSKNNHTSEGNMIPEWIAKILMTWAHIAVGLSVLFLSFVCTGMMVKWSRSIHDQIEQMRKLRNRPSKEGGL